MKQCLSTTRRRLMQGAAALGASFALPRSAAARADLRREILRIPGLDAALPGEADWRRVGALCLGGTRATVRAGEFRGVSLTFAGLAGRNSHNALFRGLLQPWAEYTGADFAWIDLSPSKLASAASLADHDIVELDGHFEGEVLGSGMASEMPGWARDLIEVDDYAECFKGSVGTWNGRRYRVAIDGSCHLLNYRADYFADGDLARAWAEEGHEGPWQVPATWDRVTEVTAFLKGKRDPAGRPAYGWPHRFRAWGG